ncbi:hypothetical protein FPSE_06184 [Fusarium pseudograminearum CS3096]|uniref:Uncharacterized protein n=1 Tax=Fusarium pseudograminearum (strain CS3096) TaxID=1028729 RepID=K3UMZ9_FUSPC|nr:hypothetical protein FPSE_06184 [Fusarium pseudograminearum CS3096]EKJ73566.1 hypothetical protein FPSE_06184 [Fusarium pseudograminearum CS3096]
MPDQQPWFSGLGIFTRSSTSAQVRWYFPMPNFMLYSVARSGTTTNVTKTPPGMLLAFGSSESFTPSRISTEYEQRQIQERNVRILASNPDQGVSLKDLPHLILPPVWLFYEQHGLASRLRIGASA